MPRVTLLDLTAGQVANIEKDLELPLNRWQSEAPKAELYARILSEANGRPIEEYRALKMRDLITLVSLDGDDEDPTPPSAD
jgi:hypothetical protein